MKSKMPPATKSTTGQPPKPNRSKTVCIPVYTFGYALLQTAQIMAPCEAICLMEKTYCPLRYLSEWLAALPVIQTSECRYVFGSGKVAYSPRGEAVSIYVRVAKLPSHTHVSPQGEAKVKLSDLTVFLTVQPLPFLQREFGWTNIRRVRPIALTDEVVTFEDA